MEELEASWRLADVERVTEVLRQAGVERRSPSVDWSLYGEQLRWALADWLERHLGWGGKFAEGAVAWSAVLVVLAAASVVVVWLSTVVIRRRRLTEEPEPTVTTMVLKELSTEQWLKRAQEFLQQGELHQALTAIWYWLGCRLGARGGASGRWTAADLVRLADTESLRASITLLEAETYGPRSSSTTRVTELLERLVAESRA